MHTIIRALDRNRLADVIAVAEQGVRDIPLYRWLLGEHIDDQNKREWLAELILRPLLNAGCVVGAVDSHGTLVGVVAWQPHDVNLSPDGTPPLTPADVEVAAATPGLRERLLELWTSPPLPIPVQDAVNCVFTAVLPDHRRGSLVLDMMETCEQFCADRNRPFYAWTGSPHLRDWFVSGWETTWFSTIEWNGVSYYGVVSDRPPKPHTRHR